MEIHDKFLNVIATLEEPDYHTIIYFPAIKHDGKNFDLLGNVIEAENYQRPVKYIDELNPVEKIQLLGEYRKLVQEVEHLRKDTE